MRDINDAYFTWLCDKVGGKKSFGFASFLKLLVHLHSTQFIYCDIQDESRAEHGISLRYRFAVNNGFYDTPEELMDRPCSVMEMMVALAMRAEDWMDEPTIGDRTGQWFWQMVVNLGLGSMTDDNYDEAYISGVLDRFLRREYEPNGKGGLFTIRGCEYDLRKVSIWRQCCWYLDSIF